MAAPKLWYVVLNRHEARILHDLQDVHDPTHKETTFEGPDRKLRDTLEDRPTRSYSSGSGGMRAAVEPGSDPLREDALEFLRDLYAILEKRRSEFDELVLIGAPDIVGLWRKTVPDSLKKCVRREEIKNLVNLPSEELIPAVQNLMKLE